MKFRTNKSKKTILNIVLVALSCILVFGLVFGIAKTVGDKDTKTIHPSFSVGSLTADGKYQESENQIYTKKAFECTGLNVALDFDAEITYQIFFYNYDGTFLESTTSLSEHYKDGAPLFATHARIVITPSEDEEIKFYEVGGYANQISIKVDKVQGFDDKQLLLEYEVFDVPFVKGYLSSSGQVTSSSSRLFVSEVIYFDNVEAVVLKVETEELGRIVDNKKSFNICSYDNSIIANIDYSILCEFEDFSYLAIPVVDSVSSCLIQLSVYAFDSFEIFVQKASTVET